MLVYQLGDFLFHGMKGTPDFPETVSGTEVRPGVNGTTLHNLGTWGQPFEMQTVVGCVTYADAILVAELYKGMTAVNPVGLIIGSVLVPGGLFKVMSVKSDAKAVVRFKVAGDSTYYGAVVTAQWTLLPIAFSA